MVYVPVRHDSRRSVLDRRFGGWRYPARKSRAGMWGVLPEWSMFEPDPRSTNVTLACRSMAWAALRQAQRDLDEDIRQTWIPRKGIRSAGHLRTGQTKASAAHGR